MSDLDVIALALVAEALQIDSENLLFSKIKTDHPADFPQLVSRANYNIRRRALTKKIKELQDQLAEFLDAPGEHYIVDSAPAPICKLARAARSKICKENLKEQPDIGYCAAHKVHFYGFKMHTLVSARGVPIDFTLKPASIHDIRYLNTAKQKLSGCELLGDKGYISDTFKADLFTTCNIALNTPHRRNMEPNPNWTCEKRKSRKTIETRFSQLCDQFMLHRNYAKSWSGYSARIASKITSMIVLQYYNVFVSGKPIGHIKHALQY